MLNPDKTCGLFLSKTWKSSFFKLPTARPCESRTTTGTNTAFTVTMILAEPDCGGVSLVCWANKCTDNRKIQQNRTVAGRGLKASFMLIDCNAQTLHSPNEEKRCCCQRLMSLSPLSSRNRTRPVPGLHMMSGLHLPGLDRRRSSSLP